LSDSEKSEVYFLSFFVQEILFPGHTKPQNIGQKNPKMTIFKANPRLVKSSYCPKIILTYNIWTFVYQKMSKSWPLLVFVSLKNCAKKRFLKTDVAFFL
jgi:hypothetical protein